jgi:hypothetical protein
MKYEYFVIFRIYKAHSGKYPHDWQFTFLDSDDFHDMVQRFIELDHEGVVTRLE